MGNSIYGVTDNNVLTFIIISCTFVFVLFLIIFLLFKSNVKLFFVSYSAVSVSIGFLSLFFGIIYRIGIKIIFSYFLIYSFLFFLYSGVFMLILSLRRKKEKQTVIPKCILDYEKEEQKEIEVKRENDIDYSHVKNVINRLLEFNLVNSDYKLVKELESNVILLEKTGENALKSKVNDGLGMLLKMLAKYNV